MTVRSHIVSFAGLVVVCGTLTLSASAQDAVLIAAVKAGDPDIVAELVRASSEFSRINEPQADGTTALHWAVRGRNVPIFELLVQAGANLNAVNRYGVTPLSIAAGSGDTDLLERLLARGADPVAADRALREGNTLAMLAARTGNVKGLGSLFDHDAIDVNAAEHRNETTALMWAALSNQPEAVRFLVAAGADLDLRSRQTDYPHLGNGVLLTGPEDGVSFVGQTPLQRGGWTALMYAARQGALEATEALAEAGADLDALDPLGASALSLAIINGHWGVLAVLLKAGADPNVADSRGTTPLYAAVDFHTLPFTYGRPAPKPRVVAGSVNAVKMLLDAGADPNARLIGRTLRRQYTGGGSRLGEGATPLMRAASTGDMPMMRLLLEAGADASATQANGNTALLLAAGAVRGSADEPGWVPVEQAIEAVELCLEESGDIHAVNAAGSSAVHLAAGNPGAPIMIQFLVDHGARVDVQDERGRTPLDAAMEADEPNEETIAMLRRLTRNGGD